MATAENGGKKVTLTQVRMSDLYLFLEGFAPGDFSSIGAMRKTDGALKQMEKVAKGYLDRVNAVYRKMNETAEPYRIKFAEINKDLGEKESTPDEKKRLESLKQAIESEANQKIKPLSEELEKLSKEDGEKQVSLSFNPEYYVQIVDLLKKEGLKRFKVRLPLLEVMDAFEVTE